jgi:hypothetical protein
MTTPADTAGARKAPVSAPTVNLDVFGTVAGHVTIGAERFDVRHLDGDDYRLLNGGTEAGILAMYNLAEKLVPTLGADRINKLTGPQIGAIIAVADGRVQDIEAQFPNGSGPEAASETTAPPASL